MGERIRLPLPQIPFFGIWGRQEHSCQVKVLISLKTSCWIYYKYSRRTIHLTLTPTLSQRERA